MTEPVAPTRGTFTFLFTDIEGSTSLEGRVGRDRYGELRERHRAIVRQVWGTHRGREQTTEGDSFFVVFDEASDAVEAAVDAQRALAREVWPDDAPIRVRMGLNSGAAETTGMSFVGLGINRAARIAALAHGGQILMSGLTRDLLEDEALDGVRLRDLGEHRLKDIGAPVRILQVVADGLPADFPALRSLEARPNNLPTQLTTFVGRERELAEAGELLARTRLLTFTGPGGTGKTRLSIQVATASAKGFPDGIWFVALEAVRDPALVAPTIIRALGVADSTTRSAIDGVVDTIGERRMLLLLDNFEQVVAAGPVVAEILRRCPNVTCLVTTRIALRVSGEQEYPVPGLPAPPDPSRLSEVARLNLPRALREFDLDALGQFEAVRLFMARATAVKPGFSVTSANAPAVAGIVGRLHGMPLAIELAAARVKLLTSEQILARLDHHLATLTSGSRDLPERQQTLRGAIAWSYDLLDEGARELLDRLSVFRGGFELDIAEPVCGPADEIGGDAVDRIGELVDQSLVRIDEDREEPRFTMLETIREYAAEMLASHGEADEIGRRHAETCLAFAQRAAPELSGPAQRRWLDRLEREHDNMRAALDWATDHPEPELAARLAFALWRFWQKRGYLNEARARLEAMASLGWVLDPVDRAMFAEAIGGVAYWQSDRPAATRWYDEALAIWRRQGQRAQIANALYNRAYADMIDIMEGTASADTFEAGQAMMEEALAIYRELGDNGGEGNLLWGLGSFHYFTADAATAHTWYQRSLDLHRAAGDRTMEAWSLHMLTLSAAALRHWDEAREQGRHALRHFYEAGDVAGVTLVVDDLAIVALAAGDRVRAARMWGAARHLQQATGTGLAGYVQQMQELFGVPTPGDALTGDELAVYAPEGAAMGLDELVAYVLEIEDGVAPASHPEATR